MDTTLREQLLERAGARVFRRGEEYMAWNRIRDVIAYENRIGATVDGSQSYRVMLRIEPCQFEFRCECPEGDAGRCCKHVVATGLYWLRLQANGDDAKSLRQLNLSPETIASRLVDWRIQAPALNDDDLRRRYADLLGKAGLEAFALAIKADANRLIDDRSRNLHDAGDYLESASPDAAPDDASETA